MPQRGLGLSPCARSYLEYPGELLTETNGTLECWVYLTTYVFGIHQLNFIGECEGDVGGMTVDPTGYLVGDVWYTVFDTFHFDSGASTVPLNAWTHVALSWGSAGAKLFINGVLAGTQSNTGGFTHWSTNNGVFVFLAPGNYTDELRISSTQRTEFNLPSSASPIVGIQAVHM